MRTAGFVLLCLLLSASPLMAHAVYWGGSNFNWFHSTYGQPQGECSFPPYGIINNYHLTYQGSAIRSLVQQDLQDMYNQGQRSLSIYLYHSDYALNLGCQPADFPNSRSTIIETHAWSSQDQTNMQDFFNDIQAARFERIRIGFIALQSNNPPAGPLPGILQCRVGLSKWPSGVDVVQRQMISISKTGRLSKGSRIMQTSMPRP